MMTYEYRCQECGEEFSRSEHVSEHTSTPPACPECGSEDVRQLFRSVTVKTKKKS